MTLTVVRDTREQKEYHFEGVETIDRKLDVGDYSVEGYEDQFAVERKSLNDLTQSLGVDRERFEREIKRGQALDELAVVVESNPREVQQWDYYSDIHPNSILGTCRKWPSKYETLEFQWAGNRMHGKRHTLEFLTEWTKQYQD